MSNLQLALPGLLGDTVEWVWRDDFDEVSDVKRFEHATVMRDEVVRALAPRPGGVYVDATLGGGGHAEALLEAEPRARIVAFDRDPVAIEAARERLGPVSDRVTLVQRALREAPGAARSHGIRCVDGLVADLGVSSPQLDDAERGMSFRREGPIDMRMDRESGETALELIERLSDDELADVIYQFGDERRSRRIARSIKQALEAGELRTTLDLRRAIVRAVGPARVGGVDPATRTFQALRIAVNRELDELAALLAALPTIAGRGGRGGDPLLSLARGSPRQARLRAAALGAAHEEAASRRPTRRAENPRARSAKLRAARWLPEPGGARMRRARPAFLPLWTLAVMATVARSSCTSRCAAGPCSSATSSAARARSRRACAR